MKSSLHVGHIVLQHTNVVGRRRQRVDGGLSFRHQVDQYSGGEVKYIFSYTRRNMYQHSQNTAGGWC